MKIIKKIYIGAIAACALANSNSLCRMEITNYLQEPVLFVFSSDLKPDYSMIIPSKKTWYTVADQGFLSIPHIKRRYKVYILKEDKDKNKKIAQINNKAQGKNWYDQFAQDSKRVWNHADDWQLVYDQPVNEGGSRGIAINYDVGENTKIRLDTKLIV